MPFNRMSPVGAARAQKANQSHQHHRHHVPHRLMLIMTVGLLPDALDSGCHGVPSGSARTERDADGAGVTLSPVFGNEPRGPGLLAKRSELQRYERGIHAHDCGKTGMHYMSLHFTRSAAAPVGWGRVRAGAVHPRST